MRVLVQRTGPASVDISGKPYASIRNGLVVLVGFCESDTVETIDWMCKKILNLRIFPDKNDVMNQSILDFGGSILSISQFTLYADASKGNRPSYIKALSGEKSVKLYDYFNECLKEKIAIETGVFGADMTVHITNIGPTTILLER